MPRMTMEKVKAKFYECLEEEWGTFIENACWNESRFHHDPMLSSEDLKQDIFEYVYRYCFAQVYKRSKKGKIWMPYLRNSIRNCFVNIRKSKKNWRIRLDMVSSDATDMAYLMSEGSSKSLGYGITSGNTHVTHGGIGLNQSEAFFDRTTSVAEEVEYADYCREVASMLTEQEKMIFYALITPSKEFSAFIKVKTLGRSSTNITKRMISDFFEINYATVIEAFQKFRSTIELCNATM